MKRGTVEWNSGMVERWNTGMAINDPVPFLRTNWACALEIDVGMVWMQGYLQVESASKGACACAIVLRIAIAI